MPLGDDVARLIQRAAAGEDVSPQELDSVRLKLNTAETLLALFRHMDPGSGAITSLRAGQAELDTNGLRLISTPDIMDEAATVKWFDSDSRVPLGTIGGFRSGAYATLDIYANSNHKLSPSLLNGVLELAAMSSGSTNSWSTWLELYATGDETADVAILEVLTGKAGAWNSPMAIRHNFTTRENVAVFNIGKALTGDPSPEEGAMYYNKADNVLKMYADGAWRTLVSW